MSEHHSIDLLSDEAFGWYFTGLADGEGSFFFREQPPRYSTSRFHPFVASFRISMRADEADHLIALARRVKCGNIYRFNNKRSKTKANPVISWYVSKTSDLVNIVVSHFERFPLQFKKSRDFEIWKPCVLLMHEIMYRRARGNSRMGHTKIRLEERAFFMESANQLKSIKKYDSDVSKPTIDHDEKTYPLFND